MIIFIRGLPGSGKTTISNRVGEKLRWEVVHVDQFKKEIMKQNPEADFIKEVVPRSYQKTLEKLQEYKEKNAVVEEVFRNAGFVQSVIDFCDHNSIKYQWYKIIRDEELLLNIYDERTRKVKMTKELHDLFKQQMNDIKIEGEIEILNTSVGECVERIKF